MESVNFRLPVEDHMEISNHLRNLKSMYEGSEILIYGGTGFIGSWLTESLVYADMDLNLGLKLTIVTRNIKLAKHKFSQLINNKINFIEHDFALSPLNIKNNSDYIFCGATPTRNYHAISNVEEIISSSRNSALHASQSQGVKFRKTRVTHLNSGIIYGKQPLEMLTRLESDNIFNDQSQYCQAKLEVDNILKSAHQDGKIDFQSPRLFAFAGPNLQLDAHFAAGNFLINGLKGQPIVVKGNPSTIRSYMYPSDLVKSLLTVAVQSTYRNVNIGSDKSISMLQLANLISAQTSNSEIILTNPSVEQSNYVPSITNLKELMPDTNFVGIQDSIKKWIDWLHASDLAW
jgi:dTDP-glucose 4,6-dehydratase